MLLIKYANTLTVAKSIIDVKSTSMVLLDCGPTSIIVPILYCKYLGFKKKNYTSCPIKRIYVLYSPNTFNYI